ncbi:MAG: hypothetical protein J6B24_04255 [Clostridia bacterium]|nr:hypothetical protein [Clostridia bacterium]
MGNQNQDKFNQTNAGDAEAAANSQTDTAATTPTNGADDMLCLMEQNEKTCGLGQWMKCLRKPALSMQYTVEKRHVPDMDDDPTGQTQIKGSNSDTMSVKGGFTIRYFDFAAGVFTLLVAGCVVKALCCVKRLM